MKHPHPSPTPPAVPVGPVHHRVDARPTPDTKETTIMPKKPKPAAPPASATSIDMTAIGNGRPVEVKVSKQATEPMREVGGCDWALWNDTLLQRTMLACPTYTSPDGQPLENYNAGVAGLALRAFKVRDEVESMLASAAVAMHAATMECSRRAMLPNQQSDVASRLRRDAANSARVLVEVTEAIERRRGRGPQVVRVERVVVNEGGQAVVGVVSPATPALSSPPPQQAVAQGRGSDTTGDALPVVIGDARGEGE